MSSITLDYTPRAWQKECHVKKQRFSVYALHRRSGKTELAIMELIDKAIKTDKELAMFVYVAPFLRQAKAIAWARLKQKIEPLRRNSVIDINEGELSVRFKHNGAIIRLFGGDNPDAMRGLRLDGIVLDEVSQLKNELWTDIVQPALSDRLGIDSKSLKKFPYQLYSEVMGKVDHKGRAYIGELQLIDPDGPDGDTWTPSIQIIFADPLPPIKQIVEKDDAVNWYGTEIPELIKERQLMKS